ncbi:MAG: SDR family oxidoreductase [Panacagrimonas sp.]
MILVTGAARRIGAAIARALHEDGARVILHCRGSVEEAGELAASLNAVRADSARVLRANLLDVAALPELARRAHAAWGRLDGLVNNASSYAATPLATLTTEQFDELLGSNLRAPLFLVQACAPRLTEGGSIVNLLDVHARRPIAGFSAYLAAKAALWTLTEALALELAPRLRVNGVAPGLMSPEQPQFPPAQLAREAARIPLQRIGAERDIAATVRFLLSADAAYLNGAIIPVDGGLRLA